MPLGRQFQNTFFEGAGGKLTHYTDPMSDPHAKAAIEGGVKPGDHKEFNRPYVDEQPAKGVAYQGMFFSPEHFTGLKTDPTISEEERRSTISKALNLDPESYANTAKGQIPQKDYESSREAVLNATHETAIPTHMFKSDVNVNATASNKLGRSVGGDYNRFGNVIRARLTPTREIVGQETYIHQERRSTGEMLVNPNYEKDNSKLPNIFGSDGKLRTYAHGTIEPQHIFPGKGTDTAEYYAYNMKVRNGYTPSGRRRNAVVHFRRALEPVGEPQEKTRNIYQEKVKVSSDTMAHEIGHSIDPNLNHQYGMMRSLKGPDTVLEAVADGVADRFHKHGYDYERTLAPSPERAKELQTTGYSTKNKDVAGTELTKALYAAVRTHVAMGDHNYQEIQNRDALYKKHPAPSKKFDNGTISYETNPAYHEQLRHANTLLLGHLYSTHQHVRDSLDHLGVSQVGQKAANYYRSQVTYAGQDPLPGFEGHGE